MFIGKILAEYPGHVIDIFQIWLFCSFLRIEVLHSHWLI